MVGYVIEDGHKVHTNKVVEKMFEIFLVNFSPIFKSFLAIVFLMHCNVFPIKEHNSR